MGALIARRGYRRHPFVDAGTSSSWLRLKKLIATAAIVPSSASWRSWFLRSQGRADLVSRETKPSSASPSDPLRALALFFTSAKRQGAACSGI